ncbi:hypothetical protein [Vibrio sp. V37_P2S8PM304]|uniref:hypothetical protein n=2 Tax=Vibrio TaxID=662 RepID=UPI001F1C60FB|nr:hypothetical protein [Vibrio sp. V37_P2S8PM304]
MDQPTSTNESHAHMHTREGFKVTPLPYNNTPSAVFWAKMKKKHWEEEDSHLYPQSHERHLGLYTYSKGAKGGLNIFPGVYQDPNRLATDLSYANRTGLPDLPEIIRSTNTITYAMRFPSGVMGSPTWVTLPSGTDFSTLPKGNQPGHYLIKNGQLRLKTETTYDKTPSVRASPVHTMFPDSEAMVMYLTAALMSDAGKTVIEYLEDHVLPAEKKTVAIFSKTAVTAVRKFDPTVPTKMIERTLEVDTSLPRRHDNGFYPTTGQIIRNTADIDHIAVILGHRADGSLNIITCYPSKVNTNAAIGTPTYQNQDIAELIFGQHSVVTQTNASPVLRW